MHPECGKSHQTALVSCWGFRLLPEAHPDISGGIYGRQRHLGEVNINNKSLGGASTPRFYSLLDLITVTHLGMQRAGCVTARTQPRQSGAEVPAPQPGSKLCPRRLGSPVHATVSLDHLPAPLGSTGVAKNLASEARILDSKLPLSSCETLDKCLYLTSVQPRSGNTRQCPAQGWAARDMAAILVWEGGWWPPEQE